LTPPHGDRLAEGHAGILVALAPVQQLEFLGPRLLREFARRLALKLVANLLLDVGKGSRCRELVLDDPAGNQRVRATSIASVLLPWIDSGENSACTSGIAKANACTANVMNGVVSI
jgi:hypothetical protein